MAQAIPDDSLQADVNRLHSLVADLWYPSETDAPVTVVVWPMPSPEPDSADQPTASAKLVPQELAMARDPLTEHPADHFFQPILRQPFWHSAQGEHLAQRYEALQQFLRATLTDLRTYRLGQVEVALYVIGQHPGGHYVGVKTHVVET